MELILTRRWPKSDYTIGELSLGGVVLCNTLEDTDRGLVCTMDAAEIRRRKIYGRTAIPKGRYRVAFTWSPAFSSRSWARVDGGCVPLLENVKGFEGCRIHPGNTAEETNGCILPGKNTAKGRVTASQEHYRLLVDNYLKPCWKRGESVYITIK